MSRLLTHGHPDSGKKGSILFEQNPQKETRSTSYLVHDAIEDQVSDETFKHCQGHNGPERNEK